MYFFQKFDCHPSRQYHRIRVMLLLGGVGLLAPMAWSQTTLYWDINGTATGAGGATPSGTWKTSGAANNNWNTDVNGGSGTISAWTNGDIAVFSAGTDATGSYSVTVAGAPTVDSIVIEQGNLTFNSSSLTLTGSTPSVEVASGLTAVFNSKFLGSNGFVKTGAGTLVMNSTGNNYTGDTVVTAGLLQLGPGTNILPNASAVSVASGASLQLATGGWTETIASLSGAGSVDFADNTFKTGDATNTTFSGALSGTGTLTKQGAGTFTLAGNDSALSGTLNLAAGNLVAASNNALGSTSVSVSTGAALQLSGGISSAPSDVTIRGTGTDGTGALRSLDGSNTLAAGVTLSSAATIAADAGSTLTISGDISRGSQNLTVDGAGSTVLSGVITGSSGAQLIKTGTGSLTLSGTSANTYTGATNVTDGTLNLGKGAGVNALGPGAVTVGDGIGAASSANLVLLASNQMVNTAAVTLNSDGRLALNNFSQSITTLTGTGLVDLSTSGYLTVGANDGTSSFGGSITGTGTLEKTGTGTLTFTSTISYAGTLTLSGGILQLNGAGIGLTVDTLTLTGNATIDFAGTSDTLSVTNLNLNGFTLSITSWANAADYFYAANWTGAAQDTRGLGSETQVVFDAPTYNGSNTTWQSYDDQITPVPEPPTYGALLLGTLTACFGWRRRRTRVA